MRIEGDGAAAAVEQVEEPKVQNNGNNEVAQNGNNKENFEAGKDSKIGELAQAGGIKGQQLQAQFIQAKVPAPDAPQTDATYSVGPEKRPPIHHDNGFLQNPKDPNDPKPQPTVEPGFSDRASLAWWKTKLEGAEAIQGVPFAPHNDIPDGLAAYRHFLEGNGKDRTFSYERYVENDASGKTTLQNATRDIQLAAEQKYAEMIAKDPSLKDKPVTFELTGTAIGAGSGGGTVKQQELAKKYPYPQTENWQKAIGAHSIWTSGKVTVTPPTKPGEKPQFQMDMKLHAEDRYNFNPGAQDIATGTPDADNGRFEQTGLAKQYMNYATLGRNVKWSQGNVNEATSEKVDVSRQRQPDNNRRARNRT